MKKLLVFPLFLRADPSKPISTSVCFEVRPTHGLLPALIALRVKPIAEKCSSPVTFRANVLNVSLVDRRRKHCTPARDEMEDVLWSAPIATMTWESVLVEARMG